MARNRVALLGCALMAASLVCGSAAAQDYRYDRDYDTRVSSDADYRVAPGTEEVIVRPYYDGIEKRQLTGHINGEVNPTEYSLSRAVSFSDLDLSRSDDRLELRMRVHDAAQNMCYQLDEQVPQLRGDSSADRECVRTATRNAMRDALDRS